MGSTLKLRCTCTGKDLGFKNNHPIEVGWPEDQFAASNLLKFAFLNK